MYVHLIDSNCYAYASTSAFFRIFRLGHRYIYPILDWARPGQALVLVVGILVITVATHIFLFWVYKLREFIHRRFIGIELNLTTKSMEFNENNGYTNNAFKTSVVFE